MTWKVREEGSPNVRDGLSLQQVLDGLEDGEYGPTDEVRGPDDADWTPFENHPVFAEAVALEPLPSHDDEETHVDMTPLIDVAMVLLVLSYVTDAPAVLKEMARILKPGGRAVVVDLLPHDREDFHQKMGHQVMGFELDQVRTMLEESGLKVTRATALPPEVGAKGPALFLASGMRCLGDR